MAPETSSDTAQCLIPIDHRLTLHLASPQQRGAANYVVSEIFKKRRYDHPGFEIRPTDTVVDIGANMGIFVLWAASQATQGKVLAIEPTSAIETLRINIVRNGLTNVVPIHAAAGRDGDTFEITTYPGFNIVNHHASWRPKLVTRILIKLLYGRYQSNPVVERAPVKSLKRILDEHDIERVNYLKVDCEGGEYDIFRNIDDETFARIDRIAMEFHEYTPEQKHGELVDLLKRHGFTVEIHKSFFEYHFMKFGVLWARR